jgi:hypothetical protein
MSEEKSLFERVSFTLPSGETTNWRIDCTALSDADLECLAQLAATRAGNFGRVEPISPASRRFADALRRHATGGPVLLVDDVLDSGATMEDYRGGRDAIGVVIFARGPAPDWVRPLFYVGDVVEKVEEELEELKGRVHYYQPAGEADILAAIDEIGTSRNSLLLQVTRLEEKAEMVDAAAMLLLDWRRQVGDDSEVPLSIRRWLAAYDSLGGHDGC